MTPAVWLCCCTHIRVGWESGGETVERCPESAGRLLRPPAINSERIAVLGANSPKEKGSDSKDDKENCLSSLVERKVSGSWLWAKRICLSQAALRCQSQINDDRVAWIRSAASLRRPPITSPAQLMEGGLLFYAKMFPSLR